MGIIQVFQQAARQEAVSPQGRALMRLVKSAIINAISAIVVTLSLSLNDGGVINYRLLLAAGIIAGVSTLLHGGQKLLSASSDPQYAVLGQGVGLVANEIDTKYNNLAQSLLVAQTNAPTTIAPPNVGATTSTVSTILSDRGPDPTNQVTGVQKAIFAQEQNPPGFTGN